MMRLTSQIRLKIATSIRVRLAARRAAAKNLAAKLPSK